MTIIREINNLQNNIKLEYYLEKTNIEIHNKFTALNNKIDNAVIGKTPLDPIPTNLDTINELSDNVTLNSQENTNLNKKFTTIDKKIDDQVKILKSDISVNLKNIQNIFSSIATFNGHNNINTLGTITTGIWHGSKISNDYIENSNYWNSNIIKLNSDIKNVRNFIDCRTILSKTLTVSENITSKNINIHENITTKNINIQNNLNTSNIKFNTINFTINSNGKIIISGDKIQTRTI